MSHTAADRHRAAADRFTSVVERVSDWQAPTPVEEWQARDVVEHLLTWFPSVLAAGSALRLPAGPAPADDLAGAWRVQAQGVQAILDDPEQAESPFDHPMMGSGTVAQIVDQYYTSDVFMHTWDLARASGQDDTLDPATCEAMVTGMSAMADVIRGSGQFGQQQPVADDAGPQDRLIAFIGRDPQWQPGRGRQVSP